MAIGINKTNSPTQNQRIQTNAIENSDGNESLNKQKNIDRKAEARAQSQENKSDKADKKAAKRQLREDKEQAKKMKREAQQIASDGKKSDKAAKKEEVKEKRLKKKAKNDKTASDALTASAAVTTAVGGACAGIPYAGPFITAGCSAAAAGLSAAAAAKAEDATKGIAAAAQHAEKAVQYTEEGVEQIKAAKAQKAKAEDIEAGAVAANAAIDSSPPETEQKTPVAGTRDAERTLEGSATAPKKKTKLRFNKKSVANKSTVKEPAATPATPTPAPKIPNNGNGAVMAANRTV